MYVSNAMMSGTCWPVNLSKLSASTTGQALAKHCTRKRNGMCSSTKCAYAIVTTVCHAVAFSLQPHVQDDICCRQQFSHLLIVTTSAWIGSKAVFGESLLVGLLEALAGDVLLSVAGDLIGDLLPNKDSSTWLPFAIVRYLRKTKGSA